MSARGVVVDVELDRELALPEAARDAGLAYVVLRWRGRPVARLVLERGESDAAAFEARAREIAREPIAFAERERLECPPEPSSVTVVIATRDRPADLDVCLAALRALRPGPGGIVVADSASAEGGVVAAVAARHGARLVRAPRPGLSLARNLGAHAAPGPIVAFLDDDCRVDAGWLEAIRAGFAGDGADCVTGQLLPSELDTEAQTLFLRYAHMDRRGFLPHRFHADTRESRHWPIDVWRCGSGGNLAVRLDTFWHLGGFRPDLGLGTPSLGGEDLFFLWQVLSTGGTVVYRPDAMAWHRHHRSLHALGRVLYGYGAGHAAYLLAARRSGAPAGRVAAYRASFWWDRTKRIGRSLAGLWPVPARLVWREIAGSVAGPRRFRRAAKESM